MTNDPGGLPFGDIPDPAEGRARGSQNARTVPAPTEPSLTRAARRRWAVFAALVAVAWVLTITLRSGVRGDIGASDVGLKGVAWAFLACGGLAFALVPGKKGLPRGIRLLQVLVVALPVFYAIIACASSKAAFLAALGDSAILPCLGLSIVLALGPLLLAGVVFSRTFLSAAGWHGAALGSSVALLGSIGVHAHCPVDAALHVIIGHGVPIAVGALFGAIFGALRGRV
jgi:hypothetical protein